MEFKSTSSARAFGYFFEFIFVLIIDANNTFIDDFIILCIIRDNLTD